jgi:hypothetical protein
MIAATLYDHREIHGLPQFPRPADAESGIMI